MIRRPPRSTRTDTLFPYTTLFRSLEAYDFTTKRGSQFLGDYARGADPFANIGERTVSVQVTSVVRASDRSFQVKWTETAYERGTDAGTERRLEGRRVGKACVSTVRSRWAQVH